MTKAYKVNFILSFDFTADDINTDQIAPLITHVMLANEELKAIAFEPFNETNFEVTALMILDNDQPEPSHWMPRLLSDHLCDVNSVSEFKSIEVAADQVDAEQKAISYQFLD